MSLRDRRLQQDKDELMTLNHDGSLIHVTPADTEEELPTTYNILYTCKGYVGPGQVTEEHMAELYLPAAYPQKPPIVYIMTPIFHPNMTSFTQNSVQQQKIAQLFSKVRDRQQLQQLIRELNGNKDLKKASICLDILEMNWAVNLSLVTVCLQVGEMIQYKLFKASHDFNVEASHWADRNRNLFPVDPRPLAPGLPSTGETEEITIEIES